MNLFERIEKLEARQQELNTRGFLPTFTAGGVMFAKSTGIIGNDATDFFWDATNDRLGIGTNAPAVDLEVAGIGRFNTHAEVGAGSTSSGDNTYIRLSLSAATGGRGRLDAFRSGVGGTDIIIGTVFSANLGVGVAAPTAKLHVSSNILSDAQGIRSSGTNAGFAFNDRTGAEVWQWYGTSSIARLFDGTADRLTVTTGAILNLPLSTAEYRINGTKVVDARITGWGTVSGTLSRASFNTGTITTATVAQVLGAVVTDMIAHGLIGA